MKITVHLSVPTRCGKSVKIDRSGESSVGVEMLKTKARESALDYATRNNLALALEWANYDVDWA